MGHYHIGLNTKSKELCTIVIQWIKYEYQQLPMGLCNSPDIFQENMSELFVGLDTVRFYINDLLHVTKFFGQNILMSSKRCSPATISLGSRSTPANHAFAHTNLTIWVVTSLVTRLCPYQRKSRPFKPLQSQRLANNCVSWSVWSTSIVTYGKSALRFLPH